MNEADKLEALLDIVDASRTESATQSEKMAVLGYVERRGRKGFWPTNAGWNLLGDQGRAFDNS